MSCGMVLQDYSTFLFIVDHTRVKLLQRTDEDQDFINANYLPVSEILIDFINANYFLFDRLYKCQLPPCE